jgi:hypothetical protein
MISLKLFQYDFFNPTKLKVCGSLESFNVKDQKTVMYLCFAKQIFDIKYDEQKEELFSISCI